MAVPVTPSKALTGPPVTYNSDLERLSAAVKTAGDQVKNARALGLQDLAWALINNPAFLFNR